MPRACEIKNARPTFFSLSSYFCVGILITLYNKWLLTSGFPFPVTMILAHMVMNTILAAITLWIRRSVDSCGVAFMFLGWQWYFKNILPLGVISGMDIALTTYAFTYSSVSLTEIIKSCFLVVVMGYGFIVGHDRPTAQKMLVGVLLILGSSLTTLTELEFSMNGFIASVFAGLFAAIRLLISEHLFRVPVGFSPDEHSELRGGGDGGGFHDEFEQELELDEHPNSTIERKTLFNDNNNNEEDDESKSLFQIDNDFSVFHQSTRLDPMVALLYFAPITALSLVPAFFVFEFQTVEQAPWRTQHMTAFVVIGGLLAYALQLSELSLIKYTSALTMSVSGTAKLMLVVLLSSVIFDHHMTALNKLGCALVMLGVGLYNYIRYKEHTAPQDAVRYTSVIMLVDRRNKR